MVTKKFTISDAIWYGMIFGTLLGGISVVMLIAPDIGPGDYVTTAHYCGWLMVALSFILLYWREIDQVNTRMKVIEREITTLKEKVN